MIMSDDDDDDRVRNQITGHRNRCIDKCSDRQRKKKEKRAIMKSGDAKGERDVDIDTER